MTVWLGNRHINDVLKPGLIKIKINKHINEAEDAKRSGTTSLISGFNGCSCYPNF
jgi:hypothetical protein